MKRFLFILTFLLSVNAHSQVDALVITTDHSYNGVYSTNIGVGGLTFGGFFEHLYTYSAGLNVSFIEEQAKLGPYVAFQYAPVSSKNKTSFLPVVQVWLWAPGGFNQKQIKISPTFGVSILSFLYTTVGYNFSLTPDDSAGIGGFRASVGAHIPIPTW